MIRKILVVSDTHGDDSWLKLLSNNKYDYVIHAGDHLMGKEIQTITEHYVDGNNDWSRKDQELFEVNGQRIIVVHGHNYRVSGSDKDLIVSRLSDLAKLTNANIVIYGHTHIPLIHQHDSVVYLNPGSMSYSRHDGNKYYLELSLNDQGILDINLNKYTN